MLEYIHVPFAIALSISVAWTIMFSMVTKHSIRGFRNFGILASYTLCIVFFFITKWKLVVVTWACFGISGGVIYVLYEILQNIKNSEGERQIHFGHLVYGLFTWPVMIPEAIEYSLAELGILKSKPSAGGDLD